MNEKIKKIIPKSIKALLINFYNNKLGGYATKSYSQEGEGMILRRLFESETTGFYVDIGAHHPMRFSNTYHFYKKGWTGINIDARPGTKILFESVRPKDITIEAGVSREKSELTYYMFNEPALNTFDQKLANERAADIYYIIDQAKIDCFPLSELLDSYLPPNQSISFMTIDVEGYDLQVLQSNEWNKYKPQFIIIESYETLIEDVIKSEIYKYMYHLGYRLFSKAHLSLIFKVMPE